VENEKVNLYNKSLLSEFDHTFWPYTKFVILIVSKNYVQKYWTKYEFKTNIREKNKRGFEFILPIRLYDVGLKGFEEDVVYIDMRK